MVHKAFHYDRRVYSQFDSGEDQQEWTYITKFDEDFGFGLFFENQDLFFLAIEYKNCNGFIKKFKHRLQELIATCSKQTALISYDARKRRLNAANVSLLRYAILKKNLEAVKIILDCFVQNMNKDITDPLTQRLFHASYFMEKDDLLALADSFELEFLDFLTALKLVKAHPQTVVDEGMKSYKLPKLEITRFSVLAEGESTVLDARHELLSVESQEAKDTWNKKSYKEKHRSDEHDGKEVNEECMELTALYLPLMNACDEDLYRKIHKKATKLDKLDVFNQVGLGLGLGLGSRYS